MTAASFRLFRLIVGNGLRLYLRSWQGKGRHLALTLLIQGLLIAFLHVQLPVIFSQIAGFTGERAGAGLAVAFVVLFTLMAGFNRSVEVLFNRADLPYLLSSPVPERTILLTRLADVLVTTGLATLFLVLPMLNCATYLYGTHWLWGWAAWLAGIAGIASLALVTTVLTVNWIGARAARTILQILGVLVGTCAILGMQAPTWLRHLAYRGEHTDTMRRVFAAFETAPLPQLVDAASGRPVWLLALTAASLGSVLLAVRVLHRAFLTGAQGAAEAGSAGSLRATTAAGVERAWAQAFRTNRPATLVRKELRTLLRDPLLIARSSTQLISFVPALAGLFFLPRIPGIGMLAVVGASMTAITTASLMSASDESLELACTSPTSRKRAMWARALAAALPCSAIGWIGAVVMTLLGEPALGFATGFLATFLALAHAWLGGCTTIRQSAEDRAANRPVRATWQTFVAMLVSGLGAGVIASQGMGAPVFVAAPLALLTLISGGMMFLVAPRPIWAE